MIKRITNKLKSFFRQKPKTNVVSKSEPVKETKQSPQQFKQRSSEKTSAKPQTHRKPHKKETPEEYKLRHQKKNQNKQSNVGQKSKVISKPKVEHKPKVIAVPWDDSVFEVQLEEGKTRFHDLGLAIEILHAIYDLGFQYCTQVQSETLPKALKGEDVTAQAQTGTGKTAAFLITIFNHILKNPLEKKRYNGTPRALILAPTRELVLQIEKDARNLSKYINISILALLGGIGYKNQLTELKTKPCDILVCTPGRLMDFMQKKLVNLRNVEILVIDEADRMLDMGFIPSVRKIVNSTPQKENRQTMFFSATINSDVKRLAESWTKEAFNITVNPDDKTVQNIEQIIYITTISEKPTLLYNIIMQKNLTRVLVFVNKKVDAKKLKEQLDVYGVSSALLSGDVIQNQRIKRLEQFREGKIRVLVATDVASRGIHVDAISHVINYNFPQDVEEYVHRIGRTGRAGASGVSISFADEFDAIEIPKLEEYLGKKIECIFPDEKLLTTIPEMPKTTSPKKPTKRKYTSHKTKRVPKEK